MAILQPMAAAQEARAPEVVVQQALAVVGVLAAMAEMGQSQ